MKNGNNGSVRRAAAGLLAGQDMLAGVIESKAAMEPRIREEDAHDAELRFALQNEYRLECEDAMQLLTDQETVARFALEGGVGWLRIAAAECLTDPRLLSEVARTARDRDVRLAVAGRVSDEHLLGHIAKFDKDKGVRMAAFNRITDREVLADAIRWASYPEIREKALGLIGDQEVIAHAATEDTERTVRMAAVSRLTDRRTLGFIAKNETDPEIRATALERLPEELREGMEPVMEKCVTGPADVHSAGNNNETVPAWQRKGWTPLLLAIDGNDRAAVETLLHGGVDPDQPTTGELGEEGGSLCIGLGSVVKDMKAYHQVTPLIVATMDNRPEIITLLIDAGADPSKTDNRYLRPPLIWAILLDHPEALQALVDGGAATRCWDREGKTAEEYAAKSTRCRELLG